jgi:hypothetical protein
MRSIGGLIYLVIGLLIAWKKHYFGNISGIGEFINLLLAIALWPLVLFGVKFNLHFGGGKGKALGAVLLLPTLARRLFNRAA